MREITLLAKLTLPLADTIKTAIKGKATRTQTGELSIQATHLPELLTPSLVPQPRKLEDEESRTKHRHLDMLVNPKTVDILRLRSYIIKYLRDFLHERNFLEFQTPILAGNAGGATARPFTVSSNAVSSKELSLRIAPELWLKRLVVGGVDRVFELGPAFRNEGIDQTHNPEFTICEFYHAYANLDDLISLTEELFRGLAAHCQSLISTKLTSLPPIDTDLYAPPFQQAEFIPTLERSLGFTLPDLASPTALSDLTALLREHNITIATEQTDSSTTTTTTTLPQLLDRLAERYIEPISAGGAPLFVTHHPACMSPLAKGFVCPRTGQQVSARTELFVGGRELANMYEEENDPLAQRRKLVEQAQARVRVRVRRKTADGDNNLGRKAQQGVEEKEEDEEDGDEQVMTMPIDESYVHALGSGLPPTGGWGCGVERLVMLFAGTRRIGDCLSFGNLRNVVGLASGGNVSAVLEGGGGGGGGEKAAGEQTTPTPKGSVGG